MGPEEINTAQGIQPTRGRPVLLSHCTDNNMTGMHTYRLPLTIAIVIAIVVITLICTNYQSILAFAAQERDNMDTKNNQKSILKEEAVVNLFRIAVVENSKASFSAAVNALASFSGVIDLTKAQQKWGFTIGKGVAERVVSRLLEWPDEMLLLARHLHKIKLHEDSRQRILSMLLGLSIAHGDENSIQAIMKLVPAIITNPILAYNLACNSALHHNRVALLQYTKRALGLGKSPAQFRADTDFSAYLKDSEFTALLDTPLTPIKKLRADILESIDSGKWEQFDKLIHIAEGRGLALLEKDDIERSILGGNLRIFIYTYESYKKNFNSLDLDIIYSDEIAKEDFIYLQSNLLMESIKYHRLKIARFLLKNSADVTRISKNLDWNLIFKNDDAQAVRLLIKSGVDFDRKKEWNEYWAAKLIGLNTVEGEVSIGLEEALKANAIKVVRLILKRASGIHFLDRRKYIKTIRYYNSGRLSLRMIEALLGEGLSINDLRSYPTYNPEIDSLLTMAIEKNRIDLVDYLLDIKNVTLSDDSQEMRAAVERNDAPLFKRLLYHKKKHNPHWTFENTGYWKKLLVLSHKNKPFKGELMQTLFSGDKLDCIKLFATLAISPDDKSKIDILLAKSVLENNYEAAKYFLEKSADANINIHGAEGGTFPVISFAIANGEIKIASLLINFGANTRYVDLDGDTLLHDLWRCSEGPIKLSVIKRLLNDNTIDINAKNNNGQTALAYAVISSDIESARAFLKHGADIHLLNGNELDVYRLSPHKALEMADLLRRSGGTLSVKTELDLAALTDDLHGVQTRINANTTIHDCNLTFENALRGNAIKVIAWLKQHGHFSYNEKQKYFTSAINKNDIAALDILKDWGYEIIKKEEFNDFFFDVKGSDASAWNTRIWLLQNGFFTKSTREQSYWFQGKIPDIKILIKRFFVEKIVDLNQPVICKRVRELLPDDRDIFSSAFENADPAYLKQLFKCYPQEGIQKIVVTYLRDCVDNLEVDKVKTFLRELDNWKQYTLRPYTGMEIYSDEPKKLKKAKKIDYMLKQSGIKF